MSEARAAGLPTTSWGGGRLSSDAEAKFADGVAGKDLVDIQELIKSAGLSLELTSELDPWVQEKFVELWNLAQTVDPF